MFIFGLGSLFYVIILLVNAIAVLSEDRFLARVGWSSTSPDPTFGGAQDPASLKSKIINLITATRTLLRIPLIVINTLIIIYLLILG